MLPLAGCAPSINLSDRVDYLVQVRDAEERAVSEASVQAEFRNQFAKVEGRTDREGIFALDQDVSPWTTTSARGVLPWLRVMVRKVGYEPLVVDLDSSQFVHHGMRLRRVEAVTLRRRDP